MTGKSPSTTGAGSEGALTKGPFNALPPIIDLNNALVAYLLTEASAFITAAGFVGPHYRVDHDISLLVPEIWCRMYPEERDPKFLLKNGYLEKCENFNHQGAKVLASRLGCRITASFVRTFFGRMFNHPHLVFPEPMLRPEKQDPSIFADGMDNIVMTQKRVASLYFEDGSIEMAAPPLKALLHIMAHDHYQGKSLDDPAVRNLFTREHLLESDWYKQRLVAKQKIDLNLWTRHANYLEKFMARKYYSDEAGRLGIQQRLQEARQMLDQVKSRDYLKSLDGTLGAQPLAAM
jgi:phosphoenolpyruvate carboxykinase (diphosphate)